MKVITQKYGEIFIRWEYDKSKDPVTTKAILEKKIENGKETIREVVVKRRYSEKYDKIKGREISLTKLIKESFDRHMNLEDRIAVRTAYKERK